MIGACVGWSVGRLKKYTDVHDIMQDFYDVRLEYYQKRKDHLAGKLTEEWYVSLIVICSTIVGAYCKSYVWNPCISLVFMCSQVTSG